MPVRNASPSPTKKTGRTALYAQHAYDLLRGLVGLEGITTTKGAANTKHRKQQGKNFSQLSHAFFFQPLTEIIHRTTKYNSLAVDIAVFDTQRAFYKF